MDKHEPSRSNAGRLNGAKSKDPKTEGGKTRKSQNVLKDNVTIQPAGDEGGDFEKYAEGILEALNPNGPLQEAVAEHIVQCLWRLSKVPLMEAQLVKEDPSSHSTGVNFARRDWPQALLAIAKYQTQISDCLYTALEDLRLLQLEQAAKGADLPNKPELSASEAVEQALAALSNPLKPTERHPSDYRKRLTNPDLN